MADDAKTDEPEEGGAGGTPWLLVIAAALAALLLGAGGAYFLLKPTAEASTPEAASEVEQPVATTAVDRSTEFRDRLYKLQPFIVNVAGDGYSRYLKLELELETENEQVKQEVEARLAQVRDAMIVLLSSKRLSDITNFEGKSLLKEDILLRVNDLLESGEVNSVLFTEFVVQ